MNMVSEFDPEEAVSRLEASLSCELDEPVHSRLELLLAELKSFAKLVHETKKNCTEEAYTTCTMCPAISILAFSGAFLATDDSIDDVTVEDILSLEPGKSLTSSAFHKAIKAIIGLSRVENVAVLPFSLFKKCTSKKPTLPDLEEAASYFYTWLSPDQHEGSTTVVVHPPDNTRVLAICEIRTSRKWRYPHLKKGDTVGRTTSMCEAIIIAVGGVDSEKVREFEVDLRKIFRKIFPQKPVS
jgi:hypothetical protein